MADGKYPEHDKVKALCGATQIVGNFIDWLGEYGYVICTFKPSGDGDGEYLPARKTVEQLLFDHFEIDRRKFNDEKDQMLEDFRKHSALTL